MKNHMTRFLSRVLVLLMMLQLVSVGPVFATSASAENDEAEQEEILSNDAEDDVEEAAPAEEPAEEEPVEEAPVENEEPVEEPVFDVEASADEIALKDGAAIIKTSDLNEVKAILAKALIANYDPEKDYSELEWEYECKGTGGFGKLSNTDWGSIAGFTSTKLRVNYTHPALWDNADGTYRVRLADNTDVVVGFTKATKLNSGIALVENPTLKLFYNDDGSVNYDEVRAMVLEQIASTTPEGLTADDLHVTYYAASSLTGLKHDWVDFEGSSRYPAMSSGEQRIKISYDGNESYYGTEVEFTVNVEVGRDDSKLEFCENPTIKLVYNDDLSIDYSAAYQAIFNLLETKVPEDITLDDLTIEYYATAKSGSLGELGKEWMPLEGGKETLTYPGISEGTQTIRISYAGDKTHNPTSVTAEVTVLGRPEVNVAQKEGPYNVGFVFADAENYDYDATARAIYDAVVASNDQGLGYEDFTIKYNASTTLTPEYKELNYSGLLNKFTDGTWTIRFSWNGTAAYKDGYFDVEVTVTDSREASAVVLKDGAEITYNMDASVMEQAIFDNAIDWDNSALPAKEKLSLDDFTIEYYASSVSETGAFDGALKAWAPVGGGTVVVVKYPQMGAADAQQIRVTYKGSTEFRPSETVEGTLKVNKADVKVKVHSAIIRANEEVPANFVTIDPNDPKIDIYTVYAGISSSNVENDVSKLGGCIYLDLPDKFQNSVIIKIIDPVLDSIYHKSLTEIMQEGTTVGALKEALKTQEILDLLKKLNIDTGAVGQLIEVLNKLPGVFDNTRVAFGTPNHAGVYTATAITDNANYNTGVGVGVLTVLKVTKGVKITWETEIPKKLTTDEAAAFNWDAYLTVDGVAVKDASNIRYLYSGFTSKWKPYSSTTTAPTEPGRYVVTVVTINGDYLAAPVTRTFQITK